MTNRYHDIRLSRGKATSVAPIIIGSRKLPNVVGIDGTRKNQTMTMPCSVNSRLYCSSVSEHAVRRHQLKPHDPDRDAADEEEERDREGIEYGDALVVGGGSHDDSVWPSSR